MKEEGGEGGEGRRERGGRWRGGNGKLKEKSSILCVQFTDLNTLLSKAIGISEGTLKKFKFLREVV
jgi:hypothetical protein